MPRQRPPIRSLPYPETRGQDGKPPRSAVYHSYHRHPIETRAPLPAAGFLFAYSRVMLTLWQRAFPQCLTRISTGSAPAAAATSPAVIAFGTWSPLFTAATSGYSVQPST